MTFCWSQQQFQTRSSEEDYLDSSDWSDEGNNPYPPPHPHENHGPPPRPPREVKNGHLRSLYNESCTIFNDSNSTVFREKETFNVVGTVVFVGRFFNLASEVKTNLTIFVVPGKWQLQTLQGMSTISTFIPL